MDSGVQTNTRARVCIEVCQGVGESSILKRGVKNCEE